MEVENVLYLKELPDWYKSLAASLHNLLRSESFTDLTFICRDGGRVTAHMPLLINCSPMFLKILKDANATQVYS